MTARIADCRRVVVKIGSSLLVDSATGTVKSGWLASLVDDLAQLSRAGADIIVVSSGAIALGRGVLGRPHGALKLEESQAAAAVGQIALARAWSEFLGTRGMTAAQVLLTLGDTEERRRYLNARSTIETLLAQGAVPVLDGDTPETLAARVLDAEHRLYPHALALYASGEVKVDGSRTAGPQVPVNQEKALFWPPLD